MANKTTLSKIFIIIMVSLFISLFISFFSYADSKRVERVETFVKVLNHSVASSRLNISFSCVNPEADELILKIKTTTQCLQCHDCEIQIETFLGECFLLISEVFHATLGSYRCNIINDVDNVVLIINSKHQLMRPMPLPEDYI
jgi:hypothetical protein